MLELSKGESAKISQVFLTDSLCSFEFSNSHQRCLQLATSVRVRKANFEKVDNPSKGKRRETDLQEQLIDHALY